MLHVLTALTLFATVFTSLPLVQPAPTPSTPFLSLTIRHEDHSASGSDATDFKKQNALDAQKLNVQFASLKESDTCQDGQQACVSSSFAECVGGKWQLTPCSGGTICVALPLVNKAGTSLACDSEGDAATRFSAAGVDGGITGQTSNKTSGSSQSSNKGTNVANNDTSDDDNELECDDGDDDSDNTQVTPTSSVSKEKSETSSGTATATATALNRSAVVSSATPISAFSSTPSVSAIAKVQGQSIKQAATTIFLNAPASSSTEPAVATTIKLNRRQFAVSSVAVIPVTSTSVIPTSTVTPTQPTSLPSSPVVPESLSSSSVVPTESAVSATPAATSVPFSGSPTTVTVTVQTTITVTMNVPGSLGPTVGIASLSSSSITTSPTIPSPASSAPTVIGTGVISSSSSASVPTVFLSAPGLASSTAVPVSSTQAAPSVPSSAGPAVSTQSTATPPNVGFSFSTQPSLTAAPNNVNIGVTNAIPTDSAEIARLLTATIA